MFSKLIVGLKLNSSIEVTYETFVLQTRVCFKGNLYVTFTDLAYLWSVFTDVSRVHNYMYEIIGL